MAPTPTTRLGAIALFVSLSTLVGRSPAQDDAELRARVASLVAQLDDPSTFDHATTRLVALGEAAVPLLVGLLHPNENPELCADVAWILGGMGERGAAAAGALADALEQTRFAVARQSLAWAIGEVGPFSPERESLLQRLTKCAGPRGGPFELNVAITRLTLGMRPTQRELERALGGAPHETMAAARVLATGHPSGENLLPKLVGLLPRVSGEPRAPMDPARANAILVAVAEAVVAVAPDGEHVLEASAYLLRHRDARVRALAMARISAKAPSTLPWLRCWHLALADPSSAVVREALATADRHGDLSLLLVPRLEKLRMSTVREIRLIAEPRRKAVLAQLSPLGRQMHELTTCPQRELGEREDKLARDLLAAGDDVAVTTLRSMPFYFAGYLGNEEVAESARRVLARYKALSAK